jgi:hypothetical protein
MKLKNKNYKGQALVSVMVFAVVAILVTTGAIITAVINTQSTSKLTQGEEAYFYAETGVDNAVLRLLRDPDYSGETLTVGEGTVNITVSGTTAKNIISEGVLGGFNRKISASGDYINNILTINSWKEID